MESQPQQFLTPVVECLDDSDFVKTERYISAVRNKGGLVESVDNALRLLLLLRSSGPMRLVDIADELGLARSTIHRLLSTLSTRGFVIQLENRCYAVGSTFVGEVDDSADVATLRRCAGPVLAALSARTEESVSVQVLDGAFVTFVASVESTKILRVGVHTGRRLPAHRASGGKAILGCRPWPQLPTLLEPWHLDSDQLADLRRELRGIRLRGFAVNNQGTEPGVVGIGCPVIRPSGPPVAAVCVAAPTTRAGRARVRALAEDVILAAHELTDVLADQ